MRKLILTLLSILNLALYAQSNMLNNEGKTLKIGNVNYLTKSNNKVFSLKNHFCYSHEQITVVH